MAYRWGERIDVVGLASCRAGWQLSRRGNEVLSSFVSFAGMQCTRGGNTAATSTASRPAIRSPLVVVVAVRMRSDTWQGRTITFTLPTHELTSRQRCLSVILRISKWYSSYFPSGTSSQGHLCRSTDSMRYFQ